MWEGNMGRVENKVALITGGARGQGRAHVRACEDPTAACLNLRLIRDWVRAPDKRTAHTRSQRRYLRYGCAT